MKKFVFSLLTAILAICNTHAQTSLVATLNHDGNITAYYGIGALSQAHSAAVNGDVITLSSGSFSSCNITKAVTIRGAGIEYNDGVEPTYLLNDFRISVSDSVHFLTMEGIFHNNKINYIKLSKPVFFKCRFNEILPIYVNGISPWLDGANFIHCKVKTGIALTQGSSASFDNCIVYSPSQQYDKICSFYFNNCVLFPDGKQIKIKYGTGDYNYYYFNTGPEDISNSIIKNSIIYSISSSDYNFPVSTGLSNNVANNNYFSNSPNPTNKVVSDFSTLFKTWTEGTYSDEEKYDLTDSAATTYLGDDGKQVGIYGGTMPFDPRTTVPRITKCEVAAKTTADGKLSVDIEVKGADY